MTLDLLLIGLTIALEPLPVSAHILLLGSDGGTRKGAGYVLGWLLTLVVIVVGSLALTGGSPPAPRSAPSTAALVVKIVLGAALLVFAWRKGTRPSQPVAEPRWMARLDKVGFAAAMGLGFLLQPWPLVVAGAATVVQADLSHASTVVSLVAFCLLASSTYLVMEAYAVLSPEAARARLDSINGWIVGHRDRIVVVVSVAIGAWLVAASAYHLLR